jgi:plastocyanin
MAYVDNVLETISAVADSGLGDVTLSGAVDANARELGAADDGKSFEVTFEEPGTGTETRAGCVYTHSGRTLTRGTLLSSTTGSAITLTTAATVAGVVSAASLTNVIFRHVAGPDANTTMEAGVCYAVDLGTFTATRTYTLPATARVGDRVQLLVTAGSATHEVIVTAGSGDTLNGVAGGTEWSRLLITGETLTLKCVDADSSWVVEIDGRIAQRAKMRLSTSADGEAASTYTRPTAAPTAGAWTSTWDNASINVPASDRIAPRRAGQYEIVVAYVPKDLGTSGQFVNLEIRRNGSTVLGGPSAGLLSSGVNRITAVVMDSIAVGDYFDYWYRTEAGGLGALASANGTCTLAVEEIL